MIQQHKEQGKPTALSLFIGIVLLIHARAGKSATTEI